MEGIETAMKRVRINGKFDNDMSDRTMGFVSIETQINGIMLWLKLDRPRSPAAQKMDRCHLWGVVMG